MASKLHRFNAHNALSAAVEQRQLNVEYNKANFNANYFYAIVCKTPKDPLQSIAIYPKVAYG